MPVIIHLVTPFLFHTGSWVYSQINGIQQFENVVLTQRIAHSKSFPFKRVYSPEQFGILKRISNQIYRRISDRYGLYFGALVESVGPRLFHAHMGYEAARWLPFLRQHPRPLVTTFYGADASKLGRRPRWRRRYRKLFEYGAVFLAEGTYLGEQLIRLGCPPEKIIVHHLGVDLAQYRRKPYQTPGAGSKLIVLQVATFREKKGILYALQAIARLTQQFPNIEFRLIGKGDDARAERAIEAIVRNLNLAEHVKLLGIRSHGETITEMVGADVYLQPSVTAADGDNEGGAPVSIIEASAIGLPIVSTFHADIPEVVKDGVTGLLAPERDVDGLVHHLSFLLCHREACEKMGLAGRAHIAQQYNLEHQIPALERIYSSLIGRA